MKTKHYRLRLQIPLVSLAPAFDRLGPKLDTLIHQSAENRAKARAAAKPLALDLLSRR